MKRSIQLCRLAVLNTALILGGCNAADIVNALADVDNTDFIATETFEYSLDFTTQTELRLAGVNGTISITADPSATTVSVTGERRVGSSSTADAQEHLPLLLVIVEATSSAMIVRTEQPDETRGRAYIVDYTVTVPPSLRVLVGSVNGNITVTGAEAEVNVGNVNGNIDLVRVTGAVSVGLVNGNVIADVILPRGEDVALATVNGNLTLALNSDASASLEASWVNGGFSSSGIDLQLDQITQSTARGTLGDGAGDISMGTTNGQILVRGR